MIPDHANPIRVPPPIGPPPLSRDFVFAALLRLGFKRDEIRLEALACNPMKYRARVMLKTLWGMPTPMVEGEGASWAEALVSFREMHERFRAVLQRVEGL